MISFSGLYFKSTILFLQLYTTHLNYNKMNFCVDFFPYNESKNNISKNLELPPSKSFSHNLRRKIVVMDKQSCVFIKIDDIAYVEANGSYTTVHFLNGENMVVCKNMKTFSERLPESEFVRVHKSYSVNINTIVKYVKSDGGYLILEGGENIPVSMRKKQIIANLIEEWAV